MNENQNLPRIFALIVLFKPDPKRLSVLIDQLVIQVQEIVLIDNTELDDPSISQCTFITDRVHHIRLGNNTGIAHALNRGLEYCQSRSAQFITTFDQDSSISSDFILSLFSTFLSAEKKFGNVACLGSNPLREDGTPYYRGLKTNEHQQTSELITSGCIFPITIFQEVGLFFEDLFIDWVDFEWCWRAMSRGFQPVLATRVTMQHSVGSGDVTIFGFKVCAISSPWRNYFQFRNFVYLLFRSRCFPFGKKCYFLGRRLLSIFVIMFLMNEKPKRLKYIVRGILHGLSGRLGPF